MTEHSDAETPGTTAWFMERYGLLNENMPRTAGRMFALMLVEGGPFSFAELVKRLQVSRAGISTNTNLLVLAGMIERVSRPGDRQDYFKVVDNPWPRILEQQIAHQRKAADYARTLLAAQPDLPAAAQTRVIDMIDMIEEAVRSMSGMAGRFKERDTQSLMA